MTKSALAFHGTTFDIIDRNGQPWLRGPQIGDALGYTQANRISDLYNRNAAEFTDGMTAVVKLQDLSPQSADAGQMREVRIFSLRGAHLLGMFARTARAAEFRRWVLDVLDAQTQPAAITDAQAMQSQPAWPASRQRVLTAIENNRIVSMQIVPDNASVLPAAQWAKAIESGDVYLTPEELAQLHSVVSQQINHSYLRMHRQRKPPSAPPTMA